MSAEFRIVRAPLGWGVLAAAVAAGVLWAARDARAATSVLAAAGLVLGNAGLSAVISVLAGRLVPGGAAYAAFPSFAIRMLLVFTALTSLRPLPSIDPEVFVAAFVVALMLVLWGEARVWARTPWLALTFSPAPRREEP